MNFVKVYPNLESVDSKDEFLSRTKYIWLIDFIKYIHYPHATSEYM